MLVPTSARKAVAGAVLAVFAGLMVYALWTTVSDWKAPPLRLEGTYAVIEPKGTPVLTTGAPQLQTEQHTFVLPSWVVTCKTPNDLGLAKFIVMQGSPRPDLGRYFPRKTCSTDVPPLSDSEVVVDHYEDVSWHETLAPAPVQEGVMRVAELRGSRGVTFWVDASDLEPATMPNGDQEPDAGHRGPVVQVNCGSLGRKCGK